MVFDPYCIGNDMTVITMLYGRMWVLDEKTGTDSVFQDSAPLLSAGFYAFKMDVYLTIVDVDDER